MELNVDFDEKLEQLAKVPKPIRLAVVSAVLVAIAVGYWFLAYQPALSEKTVLTAKAQELQRELNNARAVAAKGPAFEAEIAGLERDLELALKQLPNRKQFEDLLQDISTAGKKVGVTIKSIDRAAEVPRDFYAEVPFDLEIEGSYHDLARFFEMVAALPRIVNIGALDIDVASENQTATRLKVSGKAKTYRFLSDEA
ncbi:MAG: type 4a pilus biogenesis protein PilO [Spirochaetaceae bacterium]|nr:type 4a pilus biogenesis protein PilO [Myxococcales bacterium]MCB9722925.1 type 4a pilus biogenesis protein PilO [Spirochaetaceae bacterium]